jgi:hypothetical protein
MTNTRFLAVAFTTIASFVAVNATTTHAEQMLPKGGDITCTYPVASVETGPGLLARFGGNARIEELADTEGEPFDGVVLFPDDPRLRLEVEPEAWDVSKNSASVILKAKESDWTAFGLKVGMTLDEVTAANGGPVKLTGFWQHPDGSYMLIGDFKPGRLQGGCRVIVFFAAPEGQVRTNDPLYGRDVIRSDDPDLLKRNPHVKLFYVTWKKLAE